MSPVVTRRPERRLVRRELRGGVAVAAVLAVEAAGVLWVAARLGSLLLVSHAVTGVVLALVLGAAHLVALRRLDDAPGLTRCRDTARVVAAAAVLRAVVVVAVTAVTALPDPDLPGLGLGLVVLVDSLVLLAAATYAAGGLGHAARVASGPPAGRAAPGGRTGPAASGGPGATAR